MGFGGLAWLAAGAVALGACAQILGDDFEVVASGSGGAGQGAAGPGGGATGGMNAGGGGGGGGSTTYVCSWTPNTIREVASLAGDPDPYWGGQVEVAQGDQNMRLFLQRNTAAAGSVIEMYSLRSDGDGVVSFPGFEVFDAKHAVSDKVAAVFRRSIVGAGEQIALMVVDDDDDQGSNISISGVTTPSSGFTDWSAAFAALGDGNASFIGTLAVVYSFQSQSDRTAYRQLWTGAEGFGQSFFSGQMGEQEFKIISVAHAGPQTVAFLGDRFDGAPLTRVFQVPDAHSGAPLDPVHTVPADLTDPNQAGDAFIRIHKRTTGDHLVMFAKLAGTLDIRMGIANDAELASYAIDDAAPVASLGPLSGIPQNGELVFTNDALVLAGISDANPDIIKLIIAHRADGVRFAADMPFPDPTILPANRSLISVAHSVLDEGLFDAIGGDIAFSWIFEVDGNHQRLFYGEASCSAQ